MKKVNLLDIPKIKTKSMVLANHRLKAGFLEMDHIFVLTIAVVDLAQKSFPCSIEFPAKSLSKKMALSAPSILAKRCFFGTNIGCTEA